MAGTNLPDANDDRADTEQLFAVLHKDDPLAPTFVTCGLLLSQLGRVLVALTRAALRASQPRL